MRLAFSRSVRKMNKVAIIGGSRFKELENFAITHSTSVNTPYGQPSSPLYYGIIGEQEVVFLPRRGSEAPMAPHRINYRANIWALRDAGVQTVLATAAVAGIAEQLVSGALVVPDQLIDYTYDRENTFFGDDSVVSRIDFSQPYCEVLREKICIHAKRLKLSLYHDMTYGITQGPRFETLAEIKRLKNDGCQLVGMTGMPEATLARELELDYATIAIVIRQAGQYVKSAESEKLVSNGEAALSNLIESIITAQ
ncbi:MAG: 5'-methylthioinosine phosphorylase [Enterobacterales bacterium]|jgi:5'-methylthioinosine phosphorylase